MGNVEEINIKNRTYYFFDDMVNIKDFDSSQKVRQKNDIFYIGYITMEDSDYVKINNVNPLYYLIIDIMEG